MWLQIQKHRLSQKRVFMFYKILFLFFSQPVSVLCCVTISIKKIKLQIEMKKIIIHINFLTFQLLFFSRCFHSFFIAMMLLQMILVFSCIKNCKCLLKSNVKHYRTKSYGAKSFFLFWIIRKCIFVGIKKDKIMFGESKRLFGNISNYLSKNNVLRCLYLFLHGESMKISLYRWFIHCCFV